MPRITPGRLRQYTLAVSRCGYRCRKRAHMRGGLRPGLRAANRTRKPVNSRRLDYGAAGVTRSTSRQVLPNRARCLTDYYAKFQACDRSSRSAALELTAAVSSIIRASAFWKRAFSFCLLLLLLLHLQLLVGPCLVPYPVCLFACAGDVQSSHQCLGGHPDARFSIFRDSCKPIIIHPVYMVSPDSS